MSKPNRKKIATFEQIAGMEFEPYKLPTGWKQRLPMCTADWTALDNPHGFNVRSSIMGVQKTKAELMSVLDKMPFEATRQYVEAVGNSGLFFRAMADLVEAHECRLMCALAALDRREAKAA
jgi:hypothetical protein